MELASIRGDTATLIYHPAEHEATVGQSFCVRELPSRERGLIVQIIQNDLIDYEGLMASMLQNVLERRMASVDDLVPNHERGIDELRDVKIARAKIRRKIQGDNWESWDGWVPTRNVQISPVADDELLSHVLPTAHVPLRSWARLGDIPVVMDGARLGMVSAIVGQKGSGKSHLAKLIMLALGEQRVPVVAFDMNDEYGLPGNQIMRWTQDFRLDLTETGPGIVRMIVASLAPLQPGSPSEAAFEQRLPQVFRERREACARRGHPYQIDIGYLNSLTWSGNSYVQDAILQRLEIVDEMGLFSASGEDSPRLTHLYEEACQGRALVFDLRDLSDGLRRTLVHAVNKLVGRLCQREMAAGTNRLPYMVFDEAHFYLSDDAVIDIITRARHVGISSVFATNTPARLPQDVFRQLDTLWLTLLRHDDDIRAVGKTAYADAETVESLVQRLPRHHALVVGAATDGYPLVVSVDPLPDHIPPTGVTKSAWDRF